MHGGVPVVRGGDLPEHVVEVAALHDHLLGLDQPRADQRRPAPAAAGAPSLGSGAQLHLAVGGADRLDLGDGRELRRAPWPPPRRGRPPRCMRDGVVIGQAAHQVLGGAVGDDAAAVDDDGARAHRLHLLQDVGGDDDRLVLRPSRAISLRTWCFWLGSRPSVGSSMISTCGSCRMAWAMADAALEALRQRLDPLLQHRLRARSCSTAAATRRLASSRSKPRISAMKSRNARARHVAVAGRALRQVAELRFGQLGLLEHVDAGDARAAGVRLQEAGQHLHGGRLAGAVGAEKAQHLAAAGRSSEMPSTATMSPKRFLRPLASIRTAIEPSSLALPPALAGPRKDRNMSAIVAPSGKAAHPQRMPAPPAFVRVKHARAWQCQGESAKWRAPRGSLQSAAVDPGARCGESFRGREPARAGCEGAPPSARNKTCALPLSIISSTIAPSVPRVAAVARFSD